MASAAGQPVALNLTLVAKPLIDGPCGVSAPSEQNDHGARLNPAGRGAQGLGVGPAANIVGRVEISVDTPPPRLLRLLQRWNFEFQRLPVGVDDDVQQERVSERADRRCQSV
jgi:hypothetical protein